MSELPLELCQTCKRDLSPSLIESGECIFCIQKATRERAEKAEAACAEQQRWIDATWENRSCFTEPPRLDCGNGWLSPEKAKRLREALEKIAVLKDGKMRLLEGGCQQIAQQALRETEDAPTSESS